MTTRWTWEDVVLVYVYTKRKAKKPVTRAELGRVFRELRGLEQILATLAGEGFLEFKGRAGTRPVLTREGSTAAAQRLGEHRQISAKAYLGQLLPALGAGETVPLTASELEATLISRKVGRNVRHLAKARAAFFWKQLGIDSDAPFTLGAVQRELLRRSVGREVKDAEQGFRFLVAEATGVVGPSSAGLKRLFLSKLGTRAPAREADGFGADVLAAARRSSLKFGADRAFIVGVYDAMRPAYSLEEFKARLVEAHVRREISLHRADLVEAMDAEDVRRSRVVAPGGAEFHFVGIR